MQRCRSDEPTLGEHLRQGSRTAYKAFVCGSGGVLRSFVDFVELRECYVPYCWHRARIGGYLVFGSMELAIGFARATMMPSEVWQCDVADQIELPEAAGNLHAVDTPEERMAVARAVWHPGLFPQDAKRYSGLRLPWPIGTEAWVFLRPAKRVWSSETTCSTC